MPLKRIAWPAGRVVTLEHSSEALRNNPLQDPYVRRVSVWLPPQYDQDNSKPPRGRGPRFPVLYDLVGFTGSGPAHLNWKPFDENVPERVSRLIQENKMGPCIVVFPDCFTAFGGNQYINSSAIGAYASYLTRELIPLVDREFRTLAKRENRGCFGKSSGGYGALIHGMKYAKYWGAIANHSGDSYFDFVYLPDWPRSLDELAKHRRPARRVGPINVSKEECGANTGVDDGRIRAFLHSFWAKQKPTDAEMHTMMNLCMAASYDPDKAAPLGFRVPFNLETGELLGTRWKKWLKHDPINLVGKYRDNLRTLRGLYIDCGWRDQYRIHYGTRILSKRLSQQSIPHAYYEFDDTHSGIDYRMDVSLPYLYKALMG